MRHANCFIVAEIGVNHNGSLDIAKQLIDVATSAGADAVKFQTFDIDSLVSIGAPKAEYQKNTADAEESQYDMLQKLKLTTGSYRILQAYCKRKRIEFISTPFDEYSVDLLVRDLKLRILKVASGDLMNAPLLLKIGQSKKHVILSTGMSTLGDVELALGILAFGLTQSASIRPSLLEFRRAYLSTLGQKSLAHHVTLLHATSEYPTSFEDVNLRAMDTLAAAFHLSVGLSDHTLGITVPIAAVARGATVIEKHLTLDRSMQGPDHLASLEPGEFRELVRSIRQVEKALGTPMKLPTFVEEKNAKVVRRSIVAAYPIKKGEVFTADNLAVKRPGTGLSSLYYWEMIGKIADKFYEKDELIPWT